MIDFIDPVLKPSFESARIARKYSFKKYAFIAIIVLILAISAWFIYIKTIVKLDTKPEDQINVSDKIENIEFDGNIPPIRHTP